MGGLALPAAFVQTVEQHQLAGGRVLLPRGGVDAYGYPLAIALVELYSDEAMLVRATVRVAIGFEPDAWYGSRTPAEAGAIPDIVDFTEIICFGSSRDGEPFCFDYREQTLEPSVICWDGDATTWRLIAPDSAAFVALFGLEQG